MNWQWFVTSVVEKYHK